MHSTPVAVMEITDRIPSVESDPLVQREQVRLRDLRIAWAATCNRQARLTSDLADFKQQHHAETIAALLESPDDHAAIASERPTALQAEIEHVNDRVREIEEALVIQEQRVTEVRQQIRRDRVPQVRALRDEIAATMIRHLEALGPLNAQLATLNQTWGAGVVGYSLPTDFAALGRALKSGGR